jgi:hypothetical protein
MASGYKHAFKNLDIPLDCQLLLATHSKCTKGNNEIPSGFEDRDARGIVVSSEQGLTDDGLLEIQAFREELQIRFGTSPMVCMPDHASPGVWFLGSNSTPDGTMEHANTILINDFHHALQKIGDGHSFSNKLFRAIAVTALCQRLIRLHALKDGNGRMYQQVELNREMTRVRLPMTILNSPGKLHIVSLLEIMKDMISGQRNAQDHMRSDSITDREILNTTEEQLAEHVQRYKNEFAFQYKAREAHTSVAPEPDDFDMNADVEFDLDALDSFAMEE